MRTRSAAALALIAIGCSTTEGSRTDVEADPRLGETVSQICFTSQIRNWRPHDDRSIIVRKSINEEYRLELAGCCDPEEAFMSVGLISRVGGGLCLGRGDRLVTDARPSGGDCLITRINEWHEDRVAEDAD